MLGLREWGLGCGLFKAGSGGQAGQGAGMRGEGGA